MGLNGGRYAGRPWRRFAVHVVGPSAIIAGCDRCWNAVVIGDDRALCPIGAPLFVLWVAGIADLM